MTTRRLAAKINSAERTYRSCWKLLRGWKHGGDGTSQHAELAAFQPRLFEALLTLQELRQELIAEQRRVVAQKSTLSRRRLAALLRTSTERLQHLNDAIGVGKAIGDAFAWPFYSNSRRLLSEHARNPLQRFVPSGVGGRATLIAMKEAGSLAGCFALFHDITTILRLGDISLFDPRSLRVEALGELKAGLPKNDRITIQLTIVGHTLPSKDGISLVPKRLVRRKQLRFTPNHTQQGRYVRQVRRIVDALTQATQKASETERASLDHHYDALTRLLDGLGDGEFSAASAGSGLSLFGIRMRGRTLYARTAGAFGELPMTAMEAIRAERSRLLLDGASDNALFIAPLHYGRRGATLLDGMAPLAWWPIKHAAVEDIYLQKIIVLTLFNPAHFHNACRNEGFEPILDDRGHLHELRWKKDQHAGVLTDVARFELMLTQYLFDESFLARQLAFARDRAIAIGRRAKVNLEFLQIVDVNTALAI